MTPDVDKELALLKADIRVLMQAHSDLRHDQKQAILEIYERLADQSIELHRIKSLLTGDGK
jgi:hypothetical protein